MKTVFRLIVAASLFLGSVAVAQHHHGEMPAAPPPETAPVKASTHTMGAASCNQMEVWDYSMGMCMPLAMKGMPMRMLMFHYNSFFTQTYEEGPRGRNTFTVPNMFMADLGSSVGDTHYVNVDLMGTFERWTFPKQGYPLLLQIGEENEDHQPYIDAQHPHSSPMMGLTLSDTISLGSGKDHAKIWFAPRGPSTDGPVAFMHRATGMINPDAPLGHHLGQDAGHITSTVLGALLRLGETTIEASTFNGTEPEPSKVDLPIGVLNSYAARLTQEFTSHFAAMGSFAYVKNPEPHDSTVDHVIKYSASIYNDHQFENGWMIHHSLIYGLINYYGNISALNSIGDELWLHEGAKNIFARIEHLQRSAAQLQITTTSPDEPRWVTAVTMGYSHQIASYEWSELSLGASITKDFLPGAFQSSYSGDPVSGKIFLRVGGLKMWEL